MKPRIGFIILVIILIASACSSPAPASTQAPAIPPTETTAPTETTTPTATVTPEPSFTPTPTLLPLEILDWYEHAISNLVDPANTATNVEILVHNPNDIPVYVNTQEMEFRFLNAAGEIVYASGSAYFSLWEGTWMTPGDSTGFQVCYCFESNGLERQELASIELFAPIQPATDVVYTTDIEATLGEPYDIAAAHLGGGGTAIPINMTNTGDQPLGNIPMRVIARDANGRYIGMAGFGNSVVSWTENIAIPPGESLYGSIVSDVDYFDGPLTYEFVAIGIPYEAVEATAEAALPVGTPLADWNGIPIMPGAIAGDEAGGAYQFTITASLDEITSFYQTELSNLGYELTLDVNETEGRAQLNFQKESTIGAVYIVPIGGGLHGVAIILNN